MPIKSVYILDDDEAIADAVAELCTSMGLEPHVYNCPKTFMDIVASSLEGSPSIELKGCLVLDVCMPERSGIDIQHQLKALGSPLMLVFITGHGDVPMAVEAVRRGAVDFLTKPIRNRELMDSIRRALGFSNQSVFLSVNAESVASAQARLQCLSEREYQVMEAVVRGDANKTIAYDLNISQRTVEMHRANVMGKLGMQRLADLIKLCLMAGVA